LLHAAISKVVDETKGEWNQMGTINQGSKVQLHYTLSTEDTIIDSTEGQPALNIVIGNGDIHSAIESQLMGMGESEKFSKVLDPSLAFGDYDHQLRIQISKKKLPEKWRELKRGMAFETLDHNKNLRLFRVVEATDAFIIIDGNHPLAGEIIYLDGNIVKVEEPTSH